MPRDDDRHAARDARPRSPSDLEPRAVSRSSDRSFSRGDSPVPVPRTSAAPRARRSIATFHAVARARQQRQFVGQDAVSELRNFLRVVWKSETTLNQTTESTGRRPDPSG